MDITFIKVDNNKILNEQCIKWVRKIDECLDICTKGNGCYIGDTHKVCKVNNPTTRQIRSAYSRLWSLRFSVDTTIQLRDRYAVLIVVSPWILQFIVLY